MISLEVKILDSRAVVPEYACQGDAGVDLVTIESAHLPPNGGRALLRTGLAIAIPEGYGGFVLPRSGLAAKQGVTITNAPGLIDSGYRGEIKVSLLNTDTDNAFDVKEGDRIAQLVIQRIETVQFSVVGTLPRQTGENIRAEGGFGHSGTSSSS